MSFFAIINSPTEYLPNRDNILLSLRESFDCSFYELCFFAVKYFDIDINAKYIGGNTLLHLAVELYDAKAVEYLLKQCRANPNVENGVGFTPFGFAIFYVPNDNQMQAWRKIMSLLLNYGSDIEKALAKLNDYEEPEGQNPRAIEIINNFRNNNNNNNNTNDGKDEESDTDAYNYGDTDNYIDSNSEGESNSTLSHENRNM